jgi:hypothetical protein
MYSQSALFREMISVYKLHVFRRTQYRFILVHNVPLQYMLHVSVFIERILGNT